jgi:hypothetical protein
MMMRRRLVLLAACAFSATALGAPGPDETKKLVGTYSIGTLSLTDPAPDERKDALLRLDLTGGAARELFNALHAKAQRDECLGDGTMTKTSGQIVCSRHPGGAHECWIGIDLQHQSLASAAAC